MNNGALIEKLAQSGYCLWVGTGISTYLSKGTSISIPNWTELVQEFESRLKTTQPQLPLTLLDRFENVSSQMNYYEFRKVVRELTLKKTAEAILEHARGLKGLPPEAARRLAKLGSIANPIINFNVETLTSKIFLMEVAVMKLKHME